MKYHPAFFLWIFILFSLLAPATSQTTEDGIATYSDAFNSALDQIEKNFYDKQMEGLNWSELKKSYSEKASQVANDEQFTVLLRELISKFKSSHFAFITTDDMEYYLLKSVFTNNTSEYQINHIGAWFKIVNNQRALSMLLKNGEADKAGLRIGDVILDADDKPFHPVRSFAQAGTTVKLRYQRHGKTKVSNVSVTRGNLLTAFLNASEQSKEIIRYNKHQFGYIRIWTLGATQFSQILRNALETDFQHTDGLILDLRDGFGGYYDGFVEPFFLPSVTIETTTQGGSWKSVKGYSKPVVVLINGGTRSAKEIAAYWLKISKRAVLMGTRTAGHVIAAYSVDIGKYGMLEIPIMALTFNGVNLEGKGVEPDILYKDAWDADGKDLLITNAVAKLNSMVKKQNDKR